MQSFSLSGSTRLTPGADHQPSQHQQPQQVANPYNIDIKLFGAPDVPVEATAFNELKGMLELKDSAERLYRARGDLFNQPPSIDRIVLTPDFHKAQGIPVGTVMASKGFFVPQAVGSDIGCGYQLAKTNMSVKDITPFLDEIGQSLRHVFFQGGRDIPLSPVHRVALIQEGVKGLLNSIELDNPGGIWKTVSREMMSEIASTCGANSEATSVPSCLSSYTHHRDGISRDDQVGSIGGGNHFVELQVVQEVFDPTVAYAWGLKPGDVVVMIHSGSVRIGKACAQASIDGARELFTEHVPGSLPKNKLFPVPDSDDEDIMRQFWAPHYAARNFAEVNRLVLALSAVNALSAVVGRESNFTPLYDAPHNYIRKEHHRGDEVVVHRKGAASARGPKGYPQHDRDFYGEPVMLPGAMGIQSYLMAGLGSSDALHSVSHGAGRSLRRSRAMATSKEDTTDFLKHYRVIKPYDLASIEHRASEKLLRNLMGDIRQEMPNAYKPVVPIMHALSQHGMAQPVIKFAPLLTVKA
jgi:tRNA-splicing ligase RtcB